MRPAAPTVRPTPPPLRTLKNLLTFAGRLHPVKAVAVGYAGYMLAGWLRLCLPFAERAGSEDTAALDHLFTAASAVSTTGLATVSTPERYSFFGELVILAMIQLGGLGYMTVGSFVILMGRKPLSDFRREVSQSAFVLPDGVKVESFLARVVAFTLAVEALGALALYFCFTDAGADEPVWTAVFHSVSAFCTAGFSLFPGSACSRTGSKASAITSGRTRRSPRSACAGRWASWCWATSGA